MSIFSTRNSDGASSKAESANTISKKEWAKIQDRAIRANPKRVAFASDEAIDARRRGSENYKNRHQN